MNIAPTAVPTAVLTPEAPRPLQPPTHQSSRPIIAPNRSEAAAQETRREEFRRRRVGLSNARSNTNPRNVARKLSAGPQIARPATSSRQPPPTTVLKQAVVTPSALCSMCLPSLLT